MALQEYFQPVYDRVLRNYDCRGIFKESLLWTPDLLKITYVDKNVPPSTIVFKIFQNLLGQPLIRRTNLSNMPMMEPISGKY
jgi:hypothetical protein